MKLGAHMSIGGGFHRALERGAAAGCEVVQIFSKSNQQWAARPITDEDLIAWHGALVKTRVQPAMIHSAYLINLASADVAIRKRSQAALEEEYDRARSLAVPNLVLHPGAHSGAGEVRGIRMIIDGLRRMFDRQPDNQVRLLLENTAGMGSCIGHRFEHLRDILAELPTSRAGVCIDTCHLIAAGYDLRTRETWESTVAELDRVVGLEHVHAFHVNDSKRELGSRVDRHEHIGRGHLGLGAFHCLVNDPRFAGLPMTIETEKDDAGEADRINLAVLRSLHGVSRVGPRARRFAAQEMPGSVRAA